MTTGERALSTNIKGRVSAAILTAMALAGASPAAAAIIDFDDLSGSGDLIENGYAGLGWENVYVLNPDDAPTSGYQKAIVSGTRIAYSGYDLPASITGLGAYVFDSGWFTAAFNDGLTITARGFDGDTLVHERSFTVDTKGPSQQVFKWGGISRVTFTAEGGTDQFFDMSGTNFAVDSLGIAAVPEPATWAMMVLGFAMAGAAIRRRRAVAVPA